MSCHSARRRRRRSCGRDEREWALVNVSPDILAQLQANPVLQPARRARDTGIAGIVLVDAQIDHTTGLFMLRESTRALPIWCTDNAYADLTRGNPIFAVLSHYCGVARHAMAIDGSPFRVAGVEGIEWRALAVPSVYQCTSSTSASDMKGMGIVATTFGNLPATAIISCT